MLTEKPCAQESRSQQKSRPGIRPSLHSVCINTSFDTHSFPLSAAALHSSSPQFLFLGILYLNPSSSVMHLSEAPTSVLHMHETIIHPTVSYPSCADLSCANQKHSFYLSKLYMLNIICHSAL